VVNCVSILFGGMTLNTLFKICKPKTCRVHLLKYHDYERLYFKLKNSEPYPNGWGVLVYFEHSSHPKKNTAEKRDFGM
jgi:hypothetical protein